MEIGCLVVFSISVSTTAFYYETETVNDEKCHSKNVSM